MIARTYAEPEDDIRGAEDCNKESENLCSEGVFAHYGNKYGRSCHNSRYFKEIIDSVKE